MNVQRPLNTHTQTHTLDDIACRFEKSLELLNGISQASKDSPGYVSLQRLKQLAVAQINTDIQTVERTGYNLFDVLSRFGAQTYRAALLQAKKTLEESNWLLTDPNIQTDLVDEDRILRDRVQSPDNHSQSGSGSSNQYPSGNSSIASVVQSQQLIRRPQIQRGRRRFASQAEDSDQDNALNPRTEQQQRHQSFIRDILNRMSADDAVQIPQPQVQQLVEQPHESASESDREEEFKSLEESKHSDTGLTYLEFAPEIRVSEGEESKMTTRLETQLPYERKSFTIDGDVILNPMYQQVNRYADIEALRNARPDQIKGTLLDTLSAAHVLTIGLNNKATYTEAFKGKGKRDVVGYQQTLETIARHQLDKQLPLDLAPFYFVQTRKYDPSFPYSQNPEKDKVFQSILQAFIEVTVTDQETRNRLYNLTETRDDQRQFITDEWPYMIHGYRVSKQQVPVVERVKKIIEAPEEEGKQE